MRISDWSSDVCSSDLPEAELAVSGQPRLALVRDRRLAEADPAEQPLHEPVPLAQLPQRGERARRQQAEVAGISGDRRLRQPLHAPVENVRGGLFLQIGMTSWRERVCKYV